MLLPMVFTIYGVDQVPTNLFVYYIPYFYFF